MTMLATDTVINGRYRILRTVGSGGMGSVYAAQDERLGRMVALKLLRADLATDVRARQRFLREAQIAAQLRHPHIVRTYDVGDAPEGPYLVQELLDGPTLDQALPLPPAQSSAVIDQVADALSYIHDQGYVHCDIKPHNIMLLDDPAAPNRTRAVLLDFGIARVAGADTTTLIATPHYLAPECTLGSAPTAASDLYALGIVFYQTLTGRPPFDAPNLHAVMEQHRRAALPPLGLPQPETVALEPLITKLTAKQPDARYPSAQAFRADLAAAQRSSVHNQATVAIGRAPVSAASAQPPASNAPSAPVIAAPRSTHKQIGRRFIWLPLLLGLLLLGGFVMRTAARGQRTPAPLNPPSPPTASTPPPQMIKAPPVIGLPIAQAQQQIEAVGLDFVVGDRLPSAQPVDTVIGVNPGPDQPLSPGAPVVVQLSAGPPPAEVAPPPAPAPPADDDKGKGKDKEKDDNKGKGKGKNKDD
jgi:serine/threonine-protein kinase